MTDISNQEDTLDVRDIIERVEELRNERHTTANHESNAAATAWDEENGEELRQLEALLDDLKGYGGGHEWEGDWYPVTLIRDGYFEDYARELASDIGAIDRNATWPTNHIDWKAAAESLQQDYSQVDFDGKTYWYR